MLRPLLFSSCLAVVSVLAGCAHDVASAAEDTATSADELGTNLQSNTIVRGVMSAGEKTTVRYEPAAYEPTNRVPFLAVELLPSVTKAAGDLSPKILGDRLSISVEGQFPGAPRLLVVDEQFNIIAAATGAASTNVARASVTVPPSSGRRFVLIRDQLWVSPMPFEVAVF